MNYSSDPQTFKYPYKPGEDLLTEASVAPFQAVTLKPWDLAILEENTHHPGELPWLTWRS